MDIDGDFIKEKAEPMVDELEESELNDLIEEHSAYSLDSPMIGDDIEDKAKCVKEHLHGDYIWVLRLLKDLGVSEVPVHVDCHRCEEMYQETTLSFQEDTLNCPNCGAGVFSPIP